MLFIEFKAIFYVQNIQDMHIKDNLKYLQDRIETTCHKTGRNSSDVKIVAVTKTVGYDLVQETISSGIKIIGENRVQEAWDKYQKVELPASWHLIGHLQKNKVKRALEFFNVIQSVDSLELALEINRRAEQTGQIMEIFVQVNTSDEDSKFGVTPEIAVDFCCQVAELKQINVTGLMTIGAFLPDPEDVRPCFKKLYGIFEKVNALKQESLHLDHLSMGMTNDYQTAIEEGATLVRIGRAIYGERL